MNEIAKIDDRNLIRQDSTVEDLMHKAQYLIDNKFVPSSLKTPQAVVMVIKMGENLGMDPITAMSNIDWIEGIPAPKAKALNGILTKAGVAVELIKDYEPIINRKPVPITDEVDGKKVPRVDNEGRVQYYKDENGDILYKEEEIDRVTTIRFTRVYPGIGPKSTDVSLYWSDIVKNGWHTKENFKSKPRWMLFARCISRGARIVGSDLINYAYSSEEVQDFN